MIADERGRMLRSGLGFGGTRAAGSAHGLAMGGAFVFALTIGGTGHPSFASPPFPDALGKAAVTVEQLDNPLDHGLLIGNGDLQALVTTEGGRVVLSVSKNDVWDARLDAQRDPPLPTASLVRRWAFDEGPTLVNNAVLLESNSSWQGPDSYHARAYPCPRVCARVVLGASADALDDTAHPIWTRIRAEGTVNEWRSEDGIATMRIAGRAGASNGFAYGPMNVDANRYPTLRVRVSGSANARFFIDLMPTGTGPHFGTGWQETPTEPAIRSFALPANLTIHRAILYTWTEDGAIAENRFDEVSLAGPDGESRVDLTVRPPPTARGAIDIGRAVARIERNEQGIERTTIRALADRNVVLIEGVGAGRLRASRARDVPDAAVRRVDADVELLEQTLPGDAGWKGMRFGVALASKADRSAVAVVTSRESDEPGAEALRLARKTLGESPESLVDAHESVWSDFWSKSGVELDDAEFESMWYRNLYFLRTVVRPGAVSPGLFASPFSDDIAWHGDYHTNYNIQSTYWAAYGSNHPELGGPYDRLIVDYMPRARWLCRELFGFEGAYIPHVLYAYEPPPEQCEGPTRRQYIHHVWGWTLGVAAFSAQPVWWHYKFEPSREFLEDTAYPIVRDVALFQSRFLATCERSKDGKAILAPTVSPEHWGWTKRFERNRNGTFCLGMFRYLFEAAIEGANTLGRDEPLVAEWRHALSLLPDYPVTADDPPVVVDVQDAPPIEYNIAVPATPVFPSDVVTIWSPEPQRELFARSIHALRWNGNNSAILLSVARSRLSLPDAYAFTRTELLARLRPNRTLTLNRNVPGMGINDFGHYTEQFAATMAINELLVQSVADVVRVFPAWPLDRRARFRRLRAQGGFLVSASCADGRVEAVSIESTVGGRLRFRSPWSAVERADPDGGAELMTQDDRGIIALEARPGATYVFRAGP
ncbi:MAG: hypothetical protein FJ297_10685 [Planctomycetes bacterium]|nr:hypothetical protein [Planctomycetota bacterium]